MVWRGTKKKKKLTYTMDVVAQTGLGSLTETHTLLPVPWLFKSDHQLQ